MKYLIFLFILISYSFLFAQSDDLSGIWEGTLQHENNLFHFAIKIDKNGKKTYQGTSFIKRGESEVAIRVKAKFKMNHLIFKEIEVIQKKNASQTLCIKKGRLKYFIDEGIFCLSGKWKAKDCGKGTIFLQKRGDVSCANYSTRYTKNLIVNGDFEQNYQSFQTDYQNAITLASGSYMILDNAKLMNHEHFKGRGNCKFMAVNAFQKSNKVVWEQTISVKAHTVYLLAAKTLSLNLQEKPAIIGFYIDGKQVGNSFFAPSTLNTWIQFQEKWKATETKEVKISIVCQTIQKEGNNFGLDNISFYELESSPPTPFQQQLKTAQKGTKIQLKNVLFESGTAQLLEESYQELDLLLAYLVANPSVEIIIEGHTDNIGKAEDNLILSQKRAEEIGTYLINKGVLKDRLELKGLGESEPLFSNETKEGQQQNRRVEFVISKMDEK